MGQILAGGSVYDNFSQDTLNYIEEYAIEFCKRCNISPDRDIAIDAMLYATNDKIPIRMFP